MSDTLWAFTEFDRVEPERAARLRAAPSWTELVQRVCLALSDALRERNVRFSFDQSSRDARHLRANVQFPVGLDCFDGFFNGVEGYRAQFRRGRHNGLAENAALVSALAAELRRGTAPPLTARLLNFEFIDIGSMDCARDEVLGSLDPDLSKVWICERLISSEGVRDLHVSRTGPQLVLTEGTPWSSLFPEDGEGWLDLKGAFVSPDGLYQFKSPLERAAALEQRGTA